MPGCVGPLFSNKMVDRCQEPDALCSLCPGWARPAAGCRRHRQLLLISALHWAAADENSFGYPRPPWGGWHYPTLTIIITPSNTNHNKHLPSHSTNQCIVISRLYPNYMCRHLMNKHFFNFNFFFLQCEVTARSVLLLRKGTMNRFAAHARDIVSACPREKAAGAGRCMTSRIDRK